MKKICNTSLAILFVWFSMDMFGFSIGDKILVEAAWNSIDGVWWLLFLTFWILFVIKDKIGKYLITIFVYLWSVIQYLSHWHYTLFGASAKKIVSYNQFFKNTYHIIPSSDSMVIPDFYHIVLHILILVTVICLSVFLYNSKKVFK